MGVFAEVFSYTPEQYRALSVRDYNELCEYLNERAKANRRAS